MSFRNLYVENPAKISIKHKQILIQNDNDYSFPIDDVQSILIENLLTTLSSNFISTCASNNIDVIVCNEKHLPVALILPMNGYYKKLETLQNQLNVNKRFKDRLWQKIIQNKITNQGKALKLANVNGAAALSKMAKAVKEGDMTFQEGYAANFYFKNLFGNNFKRREDNLTNGSLDYGYAIIRSCIARELCTNGFEPSLGIHHKNKLNAFNLADDMIEPFRPVVDLFVNENVHDTDTLTPPLKKMLFNLLNYDVLINQQKHTIRNAIHKMIESMTTSYQQQQLSNIILPQIIPLQEHEIA